MKLVVGLGNPGKKYQKTRHNVGFRVIDEIKKKKSKKIILLKPQTYMNESGKAVRVMAEDYKIAPEDIYVIHDDLDLPLGTIRVSRTGGSGGHKGVQSIINELGTKNFIRFRIGIAKAFGHRTSKSGRATSESAQKFVLSKFTKSEEKIIKKVIKKTTQAIEVVLKQGIEVTMNQFN